MALPDKAEQIRRVHAAFIGKAVELLQRPEARADWEALLASMTQNGWNALVEALQTMRAGERDPRRILGPLSGLDDEDEVLVEAILRGLQDPSSLPSPQQGGDPRVAAPGLAHMIHAARTGDAQALALLGTMGEQMSKVRGDMAQIAGVLRRLVDGERDPKRLGKRMSAQGRQLLAGILEELAGLEGH